RETVPEKRWRRPWRAVSRNGRCLLSRSRVDAQFSVEFASAPSNTPEIQGAEPDEHRQDQRSCQRSPRQDIYRLQVEAEAGVPNQMPNSAEHVVHQRPGVAEQNELAR